MHLFLDVHEGLPETATVADVAHAHQADLANQDEYGRRLARQRPPGIRQALGRDPRDPVLTEFVRRIAQLYLPRR